jgi:hypothetical protein
VRDVVALDLVSEALHPDAAPGRQREDVRVDPVALEMAQRRELVADDDARLVSLLSDQIFTSINKEELIIRLPAMRWFLRKGDLALLSAIHNSQPTTENHHQD